MYNQENTRPAPSPLVTQPRHPSSTDGGIFFP